MDSAPEHSDAPAQPQHPLLAMLAECREDGRPLEALQAVCAVDQATAVSTVPDGAVAASAVTFHESAQPFNDYNADAFTPTNGVVAQRLSTPERIRKRTTKLYGEIHELMDRHETRSDRQRDIMRRDSGAYRRQSSLQALSERRRSSSNTGAGTHKSTDARTRTSSTTGSSGGRQLPNLYQEFEESRRRHLLASQTERSPFPPKDPSAEPPAASDPDSFSLRFQTISLPQRRSTQQQ